MGTAVMCRCDRGYAVVVGPLFFVRLEGAAAPWSHPPECAGEFSVPCLSKGSKGRAEKVFDCAGRKPYRFGVLPVALQDVY